MKNLLLAFVLLTFAACQGPRSAPQVTPLPTTAKAPAPAPIEQTPPSSRPILPDPAPEQPKPITGYLDVIALHKVDQAIEAAIQNGKTPGGVLWVEREGQIYHKPFGNRAVEPAIEAMTEDTIFDLASLTKVIATAPAIVKLHEEGKLDINDPVAKYLPEFKQNGKDAVTIKHLLTHTSGLRPGLSLKPDWVGTEHAIDLASTEKLQTPPDTRFKYSDINYIVLGELVHKVSGSPLHMYTKEHLFEPLGMNETGFLPRSMKQPRIAPTTRTDSGMTRGVVHDPTSARMGGVAGHAGLFSTVADLAKFARMLLNQGRHHGTPILSERTVAAMTRDQTAAAVPEQRGLGWDIASPYSSPRGHLFEIGSYGHTGWTGPSIWIDPFSRTFVIFLANRNHPTEDGSVIALRRTISTLVAQAVIGYSFPSKAAPKKDSAAKRQPAAVHNGIDVLQQSNFEALAGRRVGLITNHTGKNNSGTSTIDLLHDSEQVNLVALFSPEHGIRGTEDSNVSDSRDAKTGLPIYSLYGKTRQPLPQQLADLDALVFDIQDIGCRFYTYISTMGLAMEAAAKADISFVVLDRINPISGSRVEGPLLTDATSFIAYHPLPIRHGMTVGELAQMFRQEKQLELDLQIVPIKGWKRSLWQDDTTIPWINPSPNMRSLTEAALYPGIGLIEFADISVGRGTATPFEHIGAPYIDADTLANAVSDLKLPGIKVSPVTYTPNASKFANQTCHGIRFEITDRDAFLPIDIGLSIARILHRLYPSHFDLQQVNRLLGNQAIVESLIAQRSTADIHASWQPSLRAFLKRREAHLLYP